MQDKKKQIEEMAKILCKNLNCKYCENCFHINQAKRIYKQGYQKVDKDKQVVLTKEQYIDLTLAKQSIFNMLEERDNKARKETAREIFKALYSMRDVYAEHYEYEIRLNEYNLQELAKQYGVDLG